LREIDFVHWTSYDEDHPWWGEQVMPFALTTIESLRETGGGHDRMRNPLAERMKLRADEVAHWLVQEPIFPMMLAGVNAVGNWEVALRAPELDEEITIRTIYGGEHCPAPIRHGNLSQISRRDWTSSQKPVEVTDGHELTARK
jgi:hypothetical protein